jgi:ABC-type transporter Mla subunit MlaD
VRRALAIGALLVAGVALVAFGTGASDDGGGYKVRAIFDTGGFLVPGEEVRIAGARVGAVDSVDVTGADESVHEDGSPEPGKAVVVLSIDDPGFQDFRTDAQCLIRPQSLLGEKFVECKATQPRAPGSEPPPELDVIGEGEPGEGQRLLPLERNGKAIDLDLVNNIMREPYPDRFRLILNDLGAGLAARGDDLEEVVERANPALQQTNRVLDILARQNRRLASLARDGDRVLAPLAAQRERIGGFINNATTTAEATAERRADLEAQFQKLPGFLRELRSTMTELDNFSTTSTPVISDLGDAAPDLNRINLALEPVSRSGTTALTSLGDAAEASTPDLVASEPVLRDLRDLARDTRPVAGNLKKLLRNTRTHDGYDNLMALLLNLSGSVNAFDSYGHFLRSQVPVNNCVQYVSTEASIFCDASWRRGLTQRQPSDAELLREVRKDLRSQAQADPTALEASSGERDPVAPPADRSATSRRDDAQVFLDFLIGEPETERQRGTRR